MGALEIGDQLGQGKLDVVVAASFANVDERLFRPSTRVLEIEQHIAEFTKRPLVRDLLWAALVVVRGNAHGCASVQSKSGFSLGRAGDAASGSTPCGGWIDSTLDCVGHDVDGAGAAGAAEAAGETPNPNQNPSHELSTNGVGPWRGERPRDAWFDPELLERGDSRNVIDRYRYWSVEAIRSDLDATRHPFQVAIENWQHDMNIGSIVRSANAFGAERVHIIGRRRWNKRGAMVTDRYQHIDQHDDVAAFVSTTQAEDLPIIAVDNVPGSIAIERFELPERCVLLFGQEGPGLSVEALSAADATVEISQFGSTRSINASAAAAVVMHAWITQHVNFDGSSLSP